MTEKHVLNIGLIGLGNIGTKVAEELLQNNKFNQIFNLKSVLVRDLKKYQNIAFNNKKLKKNNHDIGFDLFDIPEKLFDDEDIDVIIELIGGVDPAFEYVKKSLIAGKHVITANKELISREIKELLNISYKYNSKIKFEASVGAGIPIIELLLELSRQNEIQSIRGIINGTSNYILSKMSEDGSIFEDVLKEAQNLGFAESDPTNDVDGLDAKFKIAILGALAFKSEIPLESVYVDGIREISNKDFEYAKELGLNIKLLAFAEKEGSTISARVHPILIPINDPMAKVDRNYNVIEIEGNLIGKLWIQGEGAGSNSTASAILGDLMSLFDSRQSDIQSLNQNLKIRTIDENVNKYYLRLVVVDQPGVLAQIAGIFSDNKISIASVIQKDIYPNNQFVDLVIMTHLAIEKNVQNVIKNISLLKIVRQHPLLIRVED
jgi:homoserine dehydrogenase